METHPDDRHRPRYQALKDRYPMTPELQARLVQEDAYALRQIVREMSDALSAVVAYLIDTSRQADAGNTGAEPENRARLRSLQAEVHALRNRLPD